MRRMACVLLVLGLGSCQAMREQLGDLMTLMTAIHDTFKVPVGVNLNTNGYLTLTVPTQVVEKMSDADQQAFSLRVARFAYSHYAHPERLQHVAVVYQTRKDYGPVNYTRTASGGAWDVAELK
jgi:hypothetical protein